MKVIVIGGGPAGMLAAISAGMNKDDVTILEKMNMLGKKLLITGKGRCNITSSIPIDEFIKNVPGNGKFLYSCFNNFTNDDILNILKEEGLQTKVERGNRVFPITDKSQDVLQALLNRLKRLGVKIQTNTKVEEILLREGKVIGVTFSHNGEEKTIKADKIILATGGKSYPATGSTGDGYEIAKKVGHTITKIKPSLVPIEVRNESLQLCREMQGLSLKNVAIKIQDIKNKKVIYEDFGEMIFTHFGVSGPIILSGSAYLLRYIKEDMKQGNIKLYIDLKPALDFQKLDSRILRDFAEEKNKLFKNSLDNLLPQKIIEPIIKLSKIDPNKRVNEITKEERTKLVQLIKNLEVTLYDFRPIEEAIVTAGGVDIKEINPKTMESKIVSGLYFAGEIIDVDAYTGGFNLQIAYSTGYTAGGASNV